MHFAWHWPEAFVACRYAGVAPLSATLHRSQLGSFASNDITRHTLLPNWRATMLSCHDNASQETLRAGLVFQRAALTFQHLRLLRQQACPARGSCWGPTTSASRSEDMILVRLGAVLTASATHTHTQTQTHTQTHVGPAHLHPGSLPLTDHENNDIGPRTCTSLLWQRTGTPPGEEGGCQVATSKRGLETPQKKLNEHLRPQPPYEHSYYYYYDFLFLLLLLFVLLFYYYDYYYEYHYCY